jgi:hypothetical protein
MEIANPGRSLADAYPRAASSAPVSDVQVLADLDPLPRSAKAVRRIPAMSDGWLAIAW